MLCILTKFNKKEGCHGCQPNTFEAVLPLDEHALENAIALSGV